MLKEHGGIWLDASVILTQSLSFTHQYQQDHSSEGFMYYLDYFTWNRDYPIYETWFIASVRHSKFITEWLKEYTVILERNLLGYPYLEKLVKEYGESTYTEWIQKIQGPDYLNLHVSLQKILRLKKAPRFYSIAAECGPYYIKNCMGWWDNVAIGKALLNGWGGPVPRVIKLIGYERDKIIEMIETGYNISPASIYSRFLVSNEVQLGNTSIFAKK